MLSIWPRSGFGNTITSGLIWPLEEYPQDSCYKQLNPLLKKTVINGGITLFSAFFVYGEEHNVTDGN